jgi:ring-1,2-phenylacetyl-CoA epoxidase subunit PaaE
MSSTNFYPIVIKEIRKETHDAVSIQMDIPKELQTLFQFKAGQYLTFKVPGHPDQRRSYSLSSAPFEGAWTVAVKQLTGGLFSTMANQNLKVGDTLEVMPPTGNFCPEAIPDNAGHYVFFAAGSGITPIISMIKTLLHQNPENHCILFYSNKTSTGIIYKEQLEALKNKYIQRFTLHYLLSRERMDASLFQGRINQEKCQELLEAFPDLKRADQFFLCGPLEMIEGIKDALLSHAVDRKKIHFELFTSPEKVKTNIQEVTAANVYGHDSISQVSVNVDGVTIDFALAWHGRSVLDEAISKGADLPYSCKGGVCCTCRARLIEGEVEMDLNYALEEDELEDGYILTCQAHPRSPRVLIDFDQ